MEIRRVTRVVHNSLSYCFNYETFSIFGCLSLLETRPWHRYQGLFLCVLNSGFCQRMRALSLAACSLMATNFEVGVWLPSPTLSSGTSGFTSG